MEQFPTLTQTDIQRFNQIIKVKAVKLPLKKIQSFIKQLQDHIYPNTKPTNIKDIKDYKFLALKYKESQIPGEVLDYCNKNEGIIIDEFVERSYKDFSYNEVLKELLPDIEIPQGYETIGQIAHFNLKPSQLPYKYIFGQVLLDKNRQLRTVVNKTEKLDNVFRTPTLELLAGKLDYSAVVPEGGCNFSLDFQKVYWCTRLYSERARVLAIIKPKEIILDIFCGIGPFSIRAAYEKQCQCIANDLNPECFIFLQKNIKQNHVNNLVFPLNTDAREVVKMFYKPVQERKFPQHIKYFDHVYMNLPVLAMDFLDVFRGFQRKCIDWPLGKEMPLIHVYGFIKGVDEIELKQLAELRISKSLPNFKKEFIEYFQIIKNVTAKKKMVCISFRLSQADSLLSEQDINELETLDQNNKSIQSDEEDVSIGEINDDNGIENIQKKIKI